MKPFRAGGKLGPLGGNAELKRLTHVSNIGGCLGEYDSGGRI
jgi:hypothetical protein